MLLAARPASVAPVVRSRALAACAGAVLFAAAAAGAAGCAAAPPPPPYSPRQVVELQRWQVFDGGVAIGWVALLEIRDPRGPVRFYRIEDRAHRWVGSATEDRRFSRRVPFQQEEKDIGLWSLQ